MAEKCNCGCCFSWLSGFFAMPAIVHLIRVIAGWEMTFRGNPVAMKTSWIVFIACGVLALVFGIIGCKKHKEAGAAVTTC